MDPLPPTPPREDRPFERIALNSTELPRACWWWVPLTIGLVAASWVMIPLSLLAILGACWRFMCLRSLRIDGVDGSLPALWRRFLALWCLIGFASVLTMFLASVLGLSPEVGNLAFMAWTLWRFLVIVEILLSSIWVAQEASARDSGWAAVMVAAGFTACLLAMGIQALWLRPQNLPPIISVLVGAIGIVSGVAGPLLVADATSRLLQSVSSERLDEESEGPAGSAPR